MNGERHGKGKYTWPLGENSNRYEGEFKNNQKSGIGRMFYFEKGEYFGNIYKYYLFIKQVYFKLIPKFSNLMKH